MITSKKYYTISEVIKLLGIPAHKARSLDSLFKNKLTRIRGRRYYQEQDIKLLQDTLNNSLGHESVATPVQRRSNSKDVTSRINELISSMQNAKLELTKALI